MRQYQMQSWPHEPVRGRSHLRMQSSAPWVSGTTSAEYDDPDASPWPVLALGVLLALVCLILIARFALVMIAG